MRKFLGLFEVSEHEQRRIGGASGVGSASKHLNVFGVGGGSEGVGCGGGVV